MTSHNDNTILITGASRGLGLALARALAQRGWRLIIDARGAQALEAARAELARQTQVLAIAGDVSDPAHRQALAEAARTFGGLDAVVNNASILGPSPQPALLDYPLDMLAQVYQTNVIAPLALLQDLRGQLKPQVRIIDITSDAGVEAYPGWGGYGSSKAALEQLSAILATENPSWRIYWADPGDMNTQMHQEAFPGEDISDRPPPEASVPGLIELLEGDLPSGRYQTRALGQHQTPRVDGVRELRVSLTVENFEQALQLYRNGLGLPVLQAWENNGRGIVFGAGRATLELLDREHAETVDQIEVGRRIAGPLRLALEVPQLELYAEALLANGAEALNDPVRTPWGDRNLRLRTPDTLQLTLFERSGDQ